ncbi:alpha/beta fold hydrolase [Neobacillus niacini]|uniref:alpha/beta fold hydrolase n=1 Tax=Neobacillus niacini TaxID=86668 RepID=UPI00203CA76B|nr:alpha/beta hydrolase [Neobacillus niacini]MCM3691083.1 alpha/beta hydrolase [Neobacillus niacini]
MSIIGKYIYVNNVKTYYEELGDKQKQAIVCIHTAGRDNRQWHDLMEKLAGKYYLVALDMPGHSKSWPLPDNTCIDNADDFSHFIWSFIERLEINNPIIIGCSMGGNITFQLAADYPDQIKSIIALQGADYTPTISQQSLDMITHPYVNYPFSNIDFSETLIGSNCTKKNKDFLMYTVFQFQPFANKGDLTAYTNYDVREKMKNITCPVLMVRGKDDWIVPSKTVNETFSRLVNSRKKKLMEVEGLGHFPHVEDPELVAELINGFFEEFNL